MQFFKAAMRIGIIGINHKSADLPLREKLAKEAERLFSPSHSVHSNFSFILLSTCNRTEIYFHADNLAGTHTYLLNMIRERIEEEFEHRVYSYFGSDCFYHLARVTAGFDSALIGETEIQGQVKRAYETALTYQVLAPELHFLFQKCLKIGKNRRTEWELGKWLPSIEDAVFEMGSRILGPLREKKIIFIGLSEINQKMLWHFKEKSCGSFFICNRTFEKAQAFAKQEKAAILPWEARHAWVDFDLAIFGTKSPEFLAKREEIPHKIACKLVIDLSVPRNVDPRIGRHASVTLLNVDQISRAIDRRKKQRAAEMTKYEMHLIGQAVERQIAIFNLKELQRATNFSKVI